MKFKIGDKVKHHQLDQKYEIIGTCKLTSMSGLYYGDWNRAYLYRYIDRTCDEPFSSVFFDFDEKFIKIDQGESDAEKN